MANAQVSSTDVLILRTAPTERSFRNKIVDASVSDEIREADYTNIFLKYRLPG